jgi:hypothetical protein
MNRETKQVTCDFCGRKPLASGYHLDPNFDLCSDCFKRLQEQKLNFDELPTLMDAVAQAMRSFTLAGALQHADR